MDKDYSKAAWLNFTDIVQDKGLVNKGRARGWKTAIAGMLADLAPTEEQDVRAVDFDAAIHRYHNKNPGKLSPKSMLEYRRRLDAALDHFRQWTENPTGYKPSASLRPLGSTEGVDRPAGRRRTATAGRGTMDHQVGLGSGGVADLPPGSQSPRAGLVLPFPIRLDFTAQLVIPRDLTVEEARRLGAFLLTLAADYKPQP